NSGPPAASIHLSGIAHGRKQFVAFGIRTCAVAVARTPCVVTPSNGPKKVGSAVLPFVPSRCTSTWTHRPGGPTSGGHGPNEGITAVSGPEVPHTRFAWATRIAVTPANPEGSGGSSKSSYARATAPAIAPASAAFCA